MKFSVLIAHYNNEVFFKDCYQSLLSQSYENWEAVILDDASRPGSLEEVKRIIGNDNRFRIYENQTNQGVGVTKSKLIELADGEICGFLDPDDALLPTALESAIQAFQNKTDTVLAYSRFISCDQDLKPQQAFKNARQVVNRDPYFFNYPIQIAHFVAFKKSVYEQTEKMNPKLKIAEDQDLYLKMYEKGPVRFIDENNYLYRLHSSGTSQNDNKEKSYEYFGQVIFEAMHRRGLKKINGKKIPEHYSHYQEIFDLLDYQNSIPYRICKKIKLWLT